MRRTSASRRSRSQGRGWEVHTRAVVLLNAAEVRDDPAEFYSTTGNHNDWDSERMQEGSVLSLVFWLQC